LAVFVDLAEADGSESCPLRGEGEATDAAEEIEMGRLIAHYCSSMMACRFSFATIAAWRRFQIIRRITSRTKSATTATKSTTQIQKAISKKSLMFSSRTWPRTLPANRPARA